MLYELSTLDVHASVAADVAKGVSEWAKADAKGELLGMFQSDIGQLNQMYVLRGFATAADLTAERQRALMSASPFNAGTHLAGLSMETYAPFPYLPPVKAGAFGGVYEFRSYTLKPGGVAGVVSLWESWIAARVALSPLVIAMYAIDGAPRFTHVWPYLDASVRGKTRAEAVGKGIWPPKGTAPWLQTMRTTLALPLPGSPLH